MGEKHDRATDDRKLFLSCHFVIKIFVLSSCEWPLKTGFTVSSSLHAGKFFMLLLISADFFSK